MKYARVLLEHCPQDTTNAFIAYYTGKYQPKKDIVLPQSPPPEEGQRASATNAVQNLANLLPLPYMNTATLAPTPPSQVNGKPTVSDGQVAQDPVDYSAPIYTPPQPRSAFSSFVDHPDEFIVFLEACLKENGLKEEDKVDLYTTLFEMYLHKANERKGDEREVWEAKAKKLIEGKDVPIDTSNVLLLSHLSGFRDGTILVREQAGLRFDIFRSYTSAKDTRGAIKALRKYGPDEPQLYPAALAYFTSDPRILEEAGEELNTVLKKIDEDGLMAPLQVIQTLSSNAVATMGMVKAYLQETIERERKEISNNRRLIESYRTETEAKRKEIEELGSKPAVFQTRRCSLCGQTLDLPAVHFLCKHSFHQKCLNVRPGEEEHTECPKCTQSNATIRAIRRAQDETADRHDMFQDALQRSHDRFGTIAEFFGQGVLGGIQ
jgi:vacuolar protein sorting-associated protein 11